MHTRDIDPNEYADRITQAIQKGILFTTKANDEVNTMVIGWGVIGRVWNEKMFIAYIRTSRHSFDLVEQSNDFTINVPLDAPLSADIMRVAGTQSGRDIDKIDTLGLTLADGRCVQAPAILEAPLTLECKVVYKQLLDMQAIPDEIKQAFYPAAVSDIDALGNRYTHMVYYGRIVDSYILEAD